MCIAHNSTGKNGSRNIIIQILIPRLISTLIWVLFVGFDMHLLVQALDNPLFESKDIDVIAKSGEKFVQMTLIAKDKYVRNAHNPDLDDESEVGWLNKIPKVRLRMIDSNQFLAAPLSVLTSNLRKESSPFFALLTDALHVMTGQPQMDVTDEDINLLLRKMDFPYSYLSSPAVLEAEHPIPPRHYFDNDLTGEKLSDHDWNLVAEICKRFKITDFKGYTRLYTILDTILLSVVWESFRSGCLSIYHLDPTYVCTISSFAWQAFLFHTRASVDYIRDREMIEMIQEGNFYSFDNHKMLHNLTNGGLTINYFCTILGIRGGPCFAQKKIVTANNNERTPMGFNPSKQRSHLVYFDIVSLYAHAMCGKFPVSDYACVAPEHLEKIDWTDERIGYDNTGFILKVDLEYPHEIHSKTESLPLAPQKKSIQLQCLSDNQKENIKHLGSLGQSFTSQPKLLLDCSDKIEYVLHYKTLQYYLKSGMRLRKIHAGFQFTERDYFRTYITDNIERRKHARNKTERDLIKLMNNSIYGKSLQSNKNLLEVRFCRTRTEALEYISSPRIRDFVILKPNLSMILLHPEVIQHDKIIQSGFTVLEYAKLIFYDAWYNKLKGIFQDRIEMAYMDTDSSICNVVDPDNTFLDDLASHRQFFDGVKFQKTLMCFSVILSWWV